VQDLPRVLHCPCDEVGCCDSELFECQLACRFARGIEGFCAAQRRQYCTASPVLLVGVL
jgi:hypothetical protein